MVKIEKSLAIVFIVITVVLMTGCGKKHLRKTDPYGLYTTKHQVDEAELAKSLGVSYTVYSRETNTIEQYRRYLAKQGKSLANNYDVWLMARKFNMLPSQYLDKAIDVK